MSNTNIGEKITLRSKVLRSLCRRGGLTGYALAQLTESDFSVFDVKSLDEFLELIETSIDRIIGDEPRNLINAALNVNQNLEVGITDRTLSVFPKGSVSLRTAQRRRDGYILNLARLTIAVQTDSETAAHEDTLELEGRIKVLESLVHQLLKYHHGSSIAESIMERTQREVWTN